MSQRRRAYIVEAFCFVEQRPIFWRTEAYDARDAAQQWNIHRRRATRTSGAKAVPTSSVALDVKPAE